MRPVILCALVLITMLSDWRSARATDAPFVNPYAQADLSSPRATISTFRSSAAEAGKLIIEAYRLRKKEGGLFASKTVKAMIDRAEILIDAAAHALDLSRIPPATLMHEKVDLVLQLGEIFDRIPPPDLEEIPDAAAVSEARLADQPILRWRIPDIELLIVQLGDDTHAGEFVFSATSVALIPAIYQAINSLPDLADGEDVYRFDSLSPGRLLPPIWYTYIHAGPEWLKVPVAGQAVWQWLAIVLWVVFAGGIMTLVIGSRSPQGVEGELGRNAMRKGAVPLAVTLLAALFLFVVIDEISLAGTAYFLADVSGQILLSDWLGYPFWPARQRRN